MNPIIQLIIAEAPNLIALIQRRHAANNPDAPPLTPEEIVVAFEETFMDSIAKDEIIRAAIAASDNS